MSDKATNANGQEDDIKRKLVRRVVFAGFLIAALLGALAFIDYLGRPADEVIATGPSFSSPVPVPHKEVSLPVKPAEPAAVAEAAKIEPATEVSAAPVAPVAPAADVPARPEIAAQPELPKQTSRSAQVLPRGSRTASASTATPAEDTAAPASQFVPEPEKTAAPATQETRAPVAERAPPAPPRLFSGFAVQAGVFADAQHAEELRAKLTLNGIPSSMEARVQVGPFKTREEAEAARQKLKTLGIEGILLPPKGTKR